MADTIYSPALLIGPGTTKLSYTNTNFKGDDGQFALQVYSGIDGFITFTDCTFTGVGSNAVDLSGYTRTKFIRCKFYNEYGASGNQKGRAFHIYKPRDLIMDHCEWEEGSGGYLQESDEWQPGNISITNVRTRNSTKAKKDGTDGGSHCQALQLSGLTGYKSILVDTFEYIGEYGKSWIEDGISITNCQGTETNPIKLNNIFIRGIYPGTSFTGKDFSGSGLTIENASKYVLVDGLMVVDAMNACANIAGGSHNSITNFRFISASLQGNKSYYYWAACSKYLSDVTTPEEFSTNVFKGGVIGYNSNRELSHYYPAKPFHNFCNILKKNTGKNNDNWMEPTDFTSLEGPVTIETEDNEYKLWQQRLKDNNQYVGTQDTNMATTYSTTLKAGITLSGNSVQPIDASGKDALYKIGSIDYSSSDSTIAKIIEDTTNEKLFSVVAYKAGTITATVSYTSNTGKSVQKTFTVIVQAVEPESVDLKITFGK